MKYKLPISVSSPVAANVLRETLDELGFSYKAGSESVHYTRMALVAPLPRFSQAFVYEVDMLHIKFLVYDTVPSGPNSVLHFIEIRQLEEMVPDKPISDILKSFAAKLPRKPWEFSWRERVATGIILPEYMRAKKLWRKILE